MSAKRLRTSGGPAKARTPLVLFGGLAALALLGGCAGYSSNIAGPREAIHRGDYPTAIKAIESLAAKKDNDELLYLMDLGIAYHAAGLYEKAIDTFREAEKLADKYDYTSVSEEVGTVIVNDDVKKYRGEDFERILINVYLALDFTLLGRWEEALVECRRINHRMDLFKAKNTRQFQYNSFAKYLAATLFEARGELNDALVDYRQLASSPYGNFAYLGGPLLRTAARLRASEEVERYRKRFPDVRDVNPPGQGDVFVVFEQGKGPYKVPSYHNRLVPQFIRSPYFGTGAKLRVDGANASFPVETLFDIENVAIRELEESAAGIAAKKVAGIVAKQAIGHGVAAATDNEALGAATALILHAMDKADTRSWSTLPARLQVARLSLPAGKYDFTLDLETTRGPKPAVKRWNAVPVQAGRVTFLHYRNGE
jgi:hypothetical protein